MLQFLSWYIVITIIGLLTFPFSYRMLPALPDRGYALSRSLGLLLWAFIFWLTVSLGISQNTVGGLLLALMVVLGLSVWANWRIDRRPETVDGGKSKQPVTFNLQPIFKWCKTNGRYIISVEVVFMLAFAAMAFIRANNPDITGTEKPMEMAFINAIIHSPTFPPHDPWLSGYAISYYYFGYVMVAMLAEITSTVGSVAFNLMLALVFGLGSIGAYGLVYNLLQAYWAANPARQPETAQRLRSLLAPVLAPIFLLVLGNWSAFLEVLHKYGVGWSGKPGDTNFWTTLGLGYPPTADTPAPYNFWTWLNILDLKDPPQGTFGGPFERLGAWWASDGINGLGRWFSEAFLPDRGGWWWRASRVITDYNLRGEWNEIIDEFPAFSYLLGDLHPHVLAAPFGLLIGSLALNLYLGGFKGQTNLFKLNLPNGYVFDLKFPVKLEAFLLMSVVLGGLAFLNTWAFPMYLGLISLSLVLMLVQERGWGWDLLEDFFKFTIPLALLSVILYLPFYIGFSSQAGGILPNVIFPSRATHLWVMFGGLFVPIFVFLIYLRGKENANWRTGFLATIGLVVVLLLFSTILGIVASMTSAGQQYVSSQGSSTWDVLREALTRRLAFGGGLLTLALLIGGAGSYLVATKAQGSVDVTSTDTTITAPTSRSPIPFVLMVILLGGLLVLAPEFVFLRDQFGDRMNTIFKFYYEAWAMWSVAAAFAVIVMLSELRGLLSSAFMGLVVVLLAIGSLFSLAGFPNKTNNFDAAFVNRDNLTLDGAAYLERYHADEFAALQFLLKAAPGTIVEAVGGSYEDTFELASTYSGKPTLLGWNGHESQWRGGEKEKGTRQDDIKMLYITHDWAQAQEILTKYDIRYVYVGPRERQKYSVYDTKFIKNLSPVFSQGDVVVYIVP